MECDAEVLYAFTTLQGVTSHKTGIFMVMRTQDLINYYTIFRDLFSVLRNPSAFRALQEVVIEHVSLHLTPKPEAVVALDARGFLFGPLIALHFDIPFIPIRKRGKLPGQVMQVSYALEYGKVSSSRGHITSHHITHDFELTVPSCLSWSIMCIIVFELMFDKRGYMDTGLLFKIRCIEILALNYYVG